ncbi:MAG: hypothetical protein N2652_03035 [Kiritimatiellae bacterium]|nr:hypothetical protein [Kiritimatiellia bacterium]
MRRICRFCEQAGYPAEGEAIRVREWPLKFVVAYDALAREAVKTAEESNVTDIPLSVVRPLPLALLALRVGRQRDWERVRASLEAGAVPADEIECVAYRYNLGAQWTRFLKYRDRSRNSTGH